MTKIITIINQKGGVGKTTIAFNLAHGLADKGMNVLAIDNDPQSNLTSALLPRGALRQAPTSAMYQGEFRSPQEVRTNLWVCSASSDLDEAQLIDDGPGKFAAISQRLRQKDVFDYVLIDSSPQITNLTFAGIMAATHLLIPLQPAQFAIDGLSRLFNTVKELRSTGASSAKVIGFVMSMMKGTTLHRHKMNALRKQYPQYFLQSVIRSRTALEESPISHQSIFEYEPNGKAAAEMGALVREVLKKTGGTNGQKI